MRIKILSGEYWWGGIVHEGIRMPIGKGESLVLNFKDNNTPNQVTPLLLSSKGRYIWCETPFKAEFKNGVIETDEVVDFQEGFVTLRGAYLAAMKSYFPFDTKQVDSLFFTHPQYNTWIELMYNQTQEGILRYAQSIIDNGLPPGILMIDEGWAEDYGRFSFRAGAFTNPVGMINTLHDLGFRVMLWITPYISPDSVVFRELEKKGYLLINSHGEVAVRRWWNGFSAVLDLTNPDCDAWFSQRLHGIMDDYGVDGFKFDGGDPYMYREEDMVFQPSSPWEQTRTYCMLGKKFQYNEFRVGWKVGGQPLAMRLADKSHSWEKDGLNMLLPNSLVQGLMGYVYQCPDMIGGGEYGSFLENSGRLDQELIVRYAQAAALCPMMQFSAAPWRVLEKDKFEIVKEAARLHVQMGEYISGLVSGAVLSGEPVLRHMEYEFPNQGMELITDQFMLGSEILVAPVLKKGAVTRTVKLPIGMWEDNEGKLWKGGNEITVCAPLYKLPWFRKVE
ncbi:glycoside hydrolase family 31 protein [Eisenbergiella sp.]